MTSFYLALQPPNGLSAPGASLKRLSIPVCSSSWKSGTHGRIRLATSDLVAEQDVSRAMTWSVEIKNWHAVAAWTWDAGDDVCGICRMPFDGCPPDGKYPGEDSPVVWGICGHAFHLQCITKWLSAHTEQRCPFCRRNWEFKAAAPSEGEQTQQR